MPVKLPVLFGQMMKILASYPLLTEPNTASANVIASKQQQKESFNPEIIISESFCS